MERQIMICECHSLEHQVTFWYDEEDELQLNDETLSEMMFRKMEGHNIDLNKELGFTHLKPVKKKR